MVKRSGADPSLLRRLNVAAVIRSLYETDELTLTELVNASELSRPTVEEIAADLQSQGLIEEVVPDADAPRPVGRPAKRFRFRAGAGHLAGVDIGPHKILCLVSDLRGKIVASARADVTPSMSATERLAAAKSLVARTARGRSRLWAAGVGTTGVVSAGKVVISDRLPNWQGVDLVAGLGAGKSYPVFAGNDTKLATLAEHWRGAARDADDVVYLLIGRSISLGLLLGGKLHAGYNGAAGEIGVLRDVGWYTALDRVREYGAEKLFDAARQGDSEANAIVAAFVADLATGVAATVLTVDPQLVVIGGGLSQAGSMLAEPLHAELARLCLFPVRVETSVLGDESVALGAVRLALDHVTTELFSVVEH
ncbi:ROK family transcriptional regulator [Kibdelosporangium aridum]|uniref:ROK family transcriptional regulator n=1 Tax=Kibdelosporangium aridum TaxID=2030 RepID=A0A428ZNP5_KIBAR|nr:ROK family transcriptional regulator [Kibdelosporangium aridum]RSM89672.1 ROK family transcriptional regulator [Kibdelosporangium aridum]